MRYDAIIIGGTTGEAATLSDEERERLYAFCAEKIGGRVKLLFGTGSPDTKTAVKYTVLARKHGADGALPPHIQSVIILCDLLCLGRKTGAFFVVNVVSEDEIRRHAARLCNLYEHVGFRVMFTTLITVERVRGHADNIRKLLLRVSSTFTGFLDMQYHGCASLHESISII